MRSLSRVIKSYQYDRILPPQPLPPPPPPEKEPEVETALSEEFCELTETELSKEEQIRKAEQSAEEKLAWERERQAELEAKRKAESEELEQRDAAQRKALMDRAFEKAKQIVDSAQAFSVKTKREIEEKSREEYEDARKRGYNDGFAKGMAEGKKAGVEAGMREGEAEGRKQAEAENRAKLDELARMIETVEKMKSGILHKSEENLKDLAFTMAKTILKQELSLDGSALRSIIVAATDAYRNQTWLRIYVSEKNAGILVKTDKGIAEALRNVSENVKVVPTSGMGEGDCILEMPDQVIDAGVDSQLRKMKAAIEASEQDKTG